SGMSDPSPSLLEQRVRYEEYSLSASVNQLLGRGWALGARYKISEAELNTSFPEVVTSIYPSSKQRAVLQNLDLFAIYNHPSGLFAEGQAVWADQSNYDYSPTLPGDDFWQFNLFAGYHFPRRQAQFTIGLLNLANLDYHLNPLNLYTELPRHRTF